ncbi:hypothetical protein HG536_0H02060 [Torulaspora globosa]|uniref:Uncharacterized protein n=1 Tax=Torulaspora globosa TaxID=48254 RepID=A0A7G3ZMU5_9SACH|nr:uncharacterized protein HG536_0H02060 [Torulaspora globosa]QLL34831.1 hypothetical protein HG536_0H02060 [Torulaspora globosa]
MFPMNELPVEILWSLLKECPRELRSVNKQFYRLHNEMYKRKVSRLLSEVEEREFWNSVLRPLQQYVKSLDFLRKNSRLIVSAEGGTECIDDSWYVIYNALLGPLKCENRLVNSPAGDSLDYQRPIFTGHCVVPPNVRCRINAWFYIDNLDAARKLATLVTEFRDSPYERYQTVSPVPYIADFVTEAGVYCFNLGRLPKIDSQTFPATLELRLVERSMTLPNYFESPSLEFLGYDFNNYDRRPWLFFRIDRIFKSTLFNPFETQLSESLVRFDGRFQLPGEDAGTARRNKLL